MTSHSNNYNSKQLISLQIALGEKLEELLDFFGLDFRQGPKSFIGRCPIHGGDNLNAFNIFHTGNIIGNWKCYSHHCEKYFKSTIIGFVRGVLSHSKYGWSNINDADKLCSFNETLEFVKKFLGKDSHSLKIDFQALEKKRFVSNTDDIYYRKEPKRVLNIPRQKLIESLDIPAPYFISRGFSKEILQKYDVGFCNAPGKEMNMRAIAPIYDDEREFVIGCTGRSIFDTCPICLAFHNPLHQCPKNKHKYTKWKHNYGFKARDYLYNYWFAQPHIQEQGIAILVEGPGDVWRLEEAGIHNSIALFGCDLSDGQRNILDRSGALALIVLTDPDNAGTLAVEEIKKSCGSSYSIFAPRINMEDIGETSIDLIHKKLLPILDKIRRNLYHD